MKVILQKYKIPIIAILVFALGQTGLVDEKIANIYSLFSVFLFIGLNSNTPPPPPPPPPNTLPNVT